MKRLANRTVGKGFALVELVGVLAVIGILLSMLVPRIFASISESRLSNAVGSLNTCRSAANAYFGKYGRFGTLGGKVETNAVVINWDIEVLMPEALMDKAFGPRLSETAYIQLTDGVGLDEAPTGDNSSYNLDNKLAANKNDAYGHKVVEAIFKNITISDAWELSYRFDGDMGTPDDPAAAEDLVGRVKYNMVGGLGDARVYLGHR